MSRTVQVVPHDPVWVAMFQSESVLVLNALGAIALTAHHIGSTAIPDIVAKPIIDMLVEVAEIDAVDACNSEMARLGYEAMGEFGIPSRRFFRKDDHTGQRTHHVHVFPRGHAQVDRHLAFRDFLIAFPEWATRYSALKAELAARFSTSLEDYMAGKDSFIQEVDRLAADWKSRQTLAAPSSSVET